MPAGQPQTRTYDAAGKLANADRLQRPNHHIHLRHAEPAAQPKTPDPSLNEPPESFTYTPTGKRATMTDASGTTKYTYDDQDRLIAKPTPQGTLTYTYDSAGNVASMASSNTNGVSVAYTYDNLNRLATVVDNRLPVGQNTTHVQLRPGEQSGDGDVSKRFVVQLHLRRPATALNDATNGYNYTLGPTGNRTGGDRSRMAAR